MSDILYNTIIVIIAFNFTVVAVNGFQSSPVQWLKQQESMTKGYCYRDLPLVKFLSLVEQLYIHIQLLIYVQVVENNTFMTVGNLVL